MVKKRISIYANSDLRYDRRLQRISGSLLSGGYEVKLFGRCFSDIPVDSGNQHHLKLFIQKGKLSYLELNIRFFIHMLLKNTDAICSVDLDTLPAAWLAAKLKGCRLIQDSHEYMAEVPEVSSRPFTRNLWHRIARLFLPDCHLRYTTSQSLVDEFQLQYSCEFALIRNMPPLLDDAATIPSSMQGLPEQDYLVYLGAVNQGRGLEEILEVLSQRDEILLIIGEGDKSPEINQLIKNYQLENRVFLAGKQLPAKIPSLLKPARAGLNLLRDEGLSYRYSLANKFFDYVHAGIPQVCIDFPEYKNLMKEFRVGLSCSLQAEAIHYALDTMKSPLHQVQMRKEAEIARQQWNWQEEEKVLLDLYKKLFAGEILA